MAAARTQVQRDIKYVVQRLSSTKTHSDLYQGGFTHGFVSEFESVEDRDYYLNRDPAHLEFVASLKNVVKGVRVLDFEPGKF